MHRFRLIAPWLAAALVCVAAILVRQFLIQPPHIGHTCDAATLSLPAPGPWWCSARAAFIMTYAWGGLNGACWVLTLAALAFRREAIAALALAVGLFAIVMYSYEAGAVAITIGALVLARAQVGTRERLLTA